MIRPMPKRILVKMVPVYDGPNAHGLTLVDQKKHYDHKSRRARVEAIGAGMRQEGRDIKPGDVVILRGDAGFTMDGDPEFNRPEYGEDYRWIKESDCQAVEEVAA